MLGGQSATGLPQLPQARAQSVPDAALHALAGLSLNHPAASGPPS